MVLDFHYGGKFYDVTVHETNDNALQKEIEVVTARGKKMLRRSKQGSYVKKIIPSNFSHRSMFSTQHNMYTRDSGHVLWTYTGRNKMLPPSMCLPLMGEIASVNKASLGGCLHSSRTRARWVEGFHVFDVERDQLRQVALCP